jgi:Zn-dependent protease with chaperone function
MRADRERARLHDEQVPREQVFVAWLLFAVFLLIIIFAPTVAHAAVPHYSQAYTKAAIRSEAKIADYGKANTDALLKLAYRESRWHNWSKSRGGCWGTFQLAKSMCVGHPWSNPHWNTMRAIRYIKHRYGTPVRALAHSYRYNWY